MSFSFNFRILTTPENFTNRPGLHQMPKDKKNRLKTDEKKVGANNKSINNIRYILIS